jgi:ammonium transporter, Amt family
MHIDAGDTAWILLCTALIFFMVPGLALFYGGLVRSKNVVTTMVQCFVSVAVVGIIWVAIGYTLAFGADHGGLIGSLSHTMLNDVGASPTSAAPAIPALAFMAFQMMFAVITPALIAGAFAERMTFRGYVLFTGLWSLAVYVPLAHWEWGGGFLGAKGLGALDFAGGAVIHESAGAAALAAALYFGRRMKPVNRPYNVPMVLLGAGILWFGWFGFNGGSALSAGHVAVSAVVNTQLGASAGLIAWMIIDWVRAKRPSGIGIATGAIAGLAAITPAAGYVKPWAALVIGASAGILCHLAVRLKKRLHYDDVLDVVGVHMVGGFIGVLLTGVFASLAVNAAGADGGWAQLGRQSVLAVVALVYPFFMTLLLLWITDHLVGLRVTATEEKIGLDLSQLLDPKDVSGQLVPEDSQPT